MKSVKELSEELSVSKQTIFNNIKRLNIETIKKENTSFVKNDSDIEKIIQRVFENKKKYGYDNNTIGSNEKKVENTDTESKENNKVVKILEEQINMLNEQMKKQENRHESTVEFYRKELQERSKLLENQQILTLESNKKIQKLENELEEERQLNYSFETNPSSKQKNNSQEVMYSEEDKKVNQPPDKNINKEVSLKYDKTSEEVDNEHQNKDKIQNKKGFWRRLFGN